MLFRRTDQKRTVIQFNLRGFLTFSALLVLATGVSSYGVYKLVGHRTTAVEQRTNSSHPMPPWGDLTVREIRLSRPEEYLFCDTNRFASWVFVGMNAEQVGGVMKSCGLTESQIARAFLPSALSVSNANTVIKPDDELVLSLTPEIRARLYDELAKFAENAPIRMPWICSKAAIATIVAECKMDSATAGLLEKLLFVRDGKQCFSDREVILRQLPTQEQRQTFLQSILSQKTLLVRVNIQPDTDVERLIGYWVGPANSARHKDLRPLLESLKRETNGSSISLMYFLSPFARKHLYTFPFIPSPGENKMDCHWSTMNFFNDPPDDRFFDLNYLNPFLHQNYYQIASPTVYGDVVLLLDGRGNLIHSALHIADDIVFTKNGKSYQQPWTLMRMKDLMEIYGATPGITTSFWRNKSV